MIGFVRLRQGRRCQQDLKQGLNDWSQGGGSGWVTQGSPDSELGRPFLAPRSDSTALCRRHTAAFLETAVGCNHLLCQRRRVRGNSCTVKIASVIILSFKLYFICLVFRCASLVTSLIRGDCKLQPTLERG
jgi:hypothetical protein